MPSQPIPTDPKGIMDLVIKRRWCILIPFFLSMIAGIYLSITLPRIYEASTLILIQPQKVPEEYVQSIVTTDPGERINTLSQQILSRTNLEKIIDEFKLYQGPKYQNIYVEDIINTLRKNISVSISNDLRRQNDAFTISYQGEEPQTVMKITNALASFFIDENLRLREAQAVGTSDFLEDELSVMKKRLEAVELQLKKYRETNMGELPEQLDSNLRILDRLQEHMSEIQQRMSDAKIRLATLQSESAALRRESSPNNSSPEVTNTYDLDQLKMQLENLLTRYTEHHPDVVHLKTRIADLEKQAQSGATDENGSKIVSQSLPPDIRIQNREIIGEMKRLETDLVETKKQIEIYQRRIENTPKREQELLSLKRDYENIQATYSSLLARKLEAEIAVNMERKQKGEQFRVLDTARIPEKPVKPNMKKLFVMACGAGLGIGVGIIFLLEQLKNSFSRPEDIESGLNLPVLCTVPEIYSPRKRVLRTVEHVGCSIFTAVSIVLFGFFALLYLKGVDQAIMLLEKIT